MERPSLIHVYFILLPGSLVLDWAGPAEALRVANRILRAQGQPERFSMHFVSPTPTSSSSVDMRLCNLEPLPDTDSPTMPTPCWIVLLGQVGDCISISLSETQAVLHWLRGLRLSTGRLELLSICAGAVLAAHAGLLTGRHATTHHQHLDELRRADPACKVVANRVFVNDGAVWSSAGVTTGIDLFLHRISAVCGAALAAQVAQILVVAMRRGPNDPELSPFLAYRNHIHPALHRVQDAVSGRPSEPWSLATMAELACTSPRHLNRIFVAHAGIAPLQYLRRIRLALAQTALQSGRNVTQAAALAGFNSDTQLRRAWHQLDAAGTPSKPE